MAHAARVTLQDCQAALAKLCSPDPFSRTKAYEGRRIEEVEGGYQLVNHAKYRDKLSAEDRRKYQRQWDRLHRPNRPNKKNRTTPDRIRQDPTHTEAEAEADIGQTSLPGAGQPRPASSSDDETWLRELEANPGYQGVAIRQEFARMQAWCEVHRKQPTRRRFINWLNRAERPLQADNPTPKPSPEALGRADRIALEKQLQIAKGRLERLREATAEQWQRDANPGLIAELEQAEALVKNLENQLLPPT